MPINLSVVFPFVLTINMKECKTKKNLILRPKYKAFTAILLSQMQMKT